MKWALIKLSFNNVIENNLGYYFYASWFFLNSSWGEKKSNREILSDKYYHAIGKDFRRNDKPLSLYLGIVFVILAIVVLVR
jgi:hypothetical protein